MYVNYGLFKQKYNNFLLLKYYENNIYYNSLLHTEAGVCSLQFEEEFLCESTCMWQAEKSAGGCTVWNHRTMDLRPHDNNAEGISITLRGYSDFDFVTSTWLYVCC